jgi:hypothetical protein
MLIPRVALAGLAQFGISAIRTKHILLRNLYKPHQSGKRLDHQTRSGTTRSKKCKTHVLILIGTHERSRKRILCFVLLNAAVSRLIIQKWCAAFEKYTCTKTPKGIVGATPTAPQPSAQNLATLLPCGRLMIISSLLQFLSFSCMHVEHLL